MKKNIYKIFVLVALCVVLFTSVAIAQNNGAGGNNGANGAGGNGAGGATTTTTAAPGKIQNPIAATDLASFATSLLTIVMKIGIPLVSLMVIWSGLMFVLARGNSEKLEEAKTRFLYTLIGAGILLGAWTVATVIQATIQALMN